MKIKQTIYIDEKIAKELKIMAIKKDISFGDLAEKYILKGLQNEKKDD